MKKWLLIGFAALGLGLLASCASTPYIPKEEKIRDIVDLINKGGVNEVKGLSSVPFLLDGEIVLVQKDLAGFWDNLKASGFAMKNVKVLEIVRPGPEGYKTFGDNLDVKSFFKKYTDRDTSIVKLSSDGAAFYFLLNKEVNGYPRIQGFKGPVK